VGKTKAQVPERLIGFGEQALYFFAKLIGCMVVLPFEYRTADLSKILSSIQIIAISRFTGPERILIELKDFVCRGAILAAAEHHGSQTSIADGEGIYPLCSRPVIPESELPGRNGCFGRLFRKDRFRDGQSSGGSEKMTAAKTTHNEERTFGIRSLQGTENSLANDAPYFRNKAKTKIHTISE
jgi:hypothetical protein